MTRSSLLVALSIVVISVGGCGSSPNPTPIQDALFDIVSQPDQVLVAEPSVTFTVGSAGRITRFTPAFKNTALENVNLDQVKLYKVVNDSLIETAFKANNGVVTGEFSGGTRYMMFGPIDGFTDFRHNLLCRLTLVNFQRVVDDIRIIDPLCSRILCPSEPYIADELVRDFPFLAREPELFNIEELSEISIVPRDFDSAEPRSSARAELSSNGFSTICDQCIGRPWREPTIVPECLPVPPSTRIEGTVINIIPAGMSGETNQDSEPNVTINRANPDEIVASAFTPNPTGMGNAPIFFSTDGGSTWAINPIVQSNLNTGDITVRFTETTGNLYAGILRRPGGLRMSIQSTDDFTAATAMTVEVDRPANSSGNGPDQPYVIATDVDGQDRVYVGNNDLLSLPRSASLELTTNDTTTWATQRLEPRTTINQDLPPVRPALGADNVLYVAYIGIRSGGDQVVVVRDDNGATGLNNFQDLIGSDGNAGVRVASGLNVPFENFAHSNLGQERLVSSDLSIAVDPNDSARVCIAWGDRVSTEVITTHLRCSFDSGETWDTTDRRTLTNTKNPALAFNSNSELGFLYQSVRTVSGVARWITSIDIYSSTLRLQDTAVLATTPANTPARTFLPYIGDYVHLTSVGEAFHGIFSANNTPNLANFPLGVTYQRNANFDTQTLTNGIGNTVNVSIDPFYFTVTLED